MGESEMAPNDDSQYDVPLSDEVAGVNNSVTSEASQSTSDAASNSVRAPAESPLDRGEPTDEELVKRVRGGDQTAYELIVRRFGPPMLNTARRLLHREADAHDAVQDAFLSAFRMIDSFEGRSQLGSWLYRIVVNASLMKLRTQRRRKERSIDDLLPKYNDRGTLSDHAQSWRLTHDEAVEMREMRALVRECIADLPEPYRAVLLLRDIEELNTEETADALKISPAAVRSRLHRARQALKSLLDEHMTELPA